VGRDDAWVADTLMGRDLLTLETYALPNLEDRIIVRADRVQQDPGGRSNPVRQPNPVSQQDSSQRLSSVNRPNSVNQHDSVRQQDPVRRQDSGGQPNSDRKKKKRK